MNPARQHVDPDKDNPLGGHRFPISTLHIHLHSKHVVFALTRTPPSPSRAYTGEAALAANIMTTTTGHRILHESTALHYWGNTKHGVLDTAQSNYSYLSLAPEYAIQLSHRIWAWTLMTNNSYDTPPITLASINTPSPSFFLICLSPLPRLTLSRPEQHSSTSKAPRLALSKRGARVDRKPRSIRRNTMPRARDAQSGIELPQFPPLPAPHTEVYAHVTRRNPSAAAAVIEVPRLPDRKGLRWSCSASHFCRFGLGETCPRGVLGGHLDSSSVGKEC